MYCTGIVHFFPLSLDVLNEILDDVVHVPAGLDGVHDGLEGIGNADLVARVQPLVVVLGEVTILLHHLVQLGLDSGRRTRKRKGNENERL